MTQRGLSDSDMYFDRAGLPITLDEWARRWKTEKIVAVDHIGDVTISTVWLGLNHAWGIGPPLIFETMIFGGLHSEDQWRYQTEEQALAGHAEAVARARTEVEHGDGS